MSLKSLLPFWEVIPHQLPQIYDNFVATFLKTHSFLNNYVNYPTARYTSTLSPEKLCYFLTNWMSSKWMDVTNLECDAVVHLRNGEYGLVEIKIWGEGLINKGAASLKKPQDKIDMTIMKKPSFLMALIGFGILAYRREDGVYVVRIGCLKD